MSPRRPRLLVVTQYYRPEPNFITADVAEALSEDLDVTVITARPNYPLGRYYHGWGGWAPTRRREGSVTVWRLPLLAYHGNSLWRRALCYGSFALGALVMAPFLEASPDVVWVYQTPFTTALASLGARYLRGARLVYTAADLWPESMVAAGVARPGFLMRALYAYSRWINRAAHLIVASTEGTVERYARDGIPRERLRHIPVWVDAAPDRAVGVSGDAISVSRIVYAGNLGPAQRLDTVIRAAADLHARGVPIAVHFYGSGAAEAELRALAAALPAPNVVFHGRVPPEEALRVSATAFAQLVSLQPSALFAMTVPSKLAFCFAAGAPVLYGLQGEAARIAAQSGGGILFDPEDPASLVSAVMDLRQRSPEELSDMRAALGRYYSAHFARPRLLAQYRALLLAEARGTAPE
jgi:glycosyltransferase involved in cell wall biosynthesis